MSHPLITPSFFLVFSLLPVLNALQSAQARAAIALYFRNNGHLKDPRVVDALVMKGYMDLEETTMQVRQCCAIAAHLKCSICRPDKRENSILTLPCVYDLPQLLSNCYLCVDVHPFAAQHRWKGYSQIQREKPPSKCETSRMAAPCCAFNAFAAERISGPAKDSDRILCEADVFLSRTFFLSARLQYKQKTHLLRLLNPSAHNDARAVKDTFVDKFMAGAS